jgi:hypothetical protein
MDRRDPDPTGDEWTLLSQVLDYHRATLLRKVDGLDQRQLAMTTAASDLTLAGLLKHLTLNEDHWFRVVLLGASAVPPFDTVDWDGDPNWEFRTATDDDPADLVAAYGRACARSRDAVASVPSLDAVSRGTSTVSGTRFNARWIVLHMIQETARHNGHADLLREAIDGVTGE